MNKREQILANHDKLLEAMLNKDESTLRSLIHPDASVFGSAIQEYEKDLDKIIHYYTNSLGLLPEDKIIELKWRRYSDLNEIVLVEQEYEVHFTLEKEKITLLTLRQSALWSRYQNPDNGETSWLLLHDHSSMPDHLGAIESISLNELLERNLNLELKTEELKNKLDQSLLDLKNAHEQLMQQEKLASLGQLTAGIAHEIKNPLNFVNNFSEVILELIEEAREEIRRVTEERGLENSPLEGRAEAERRRGVSDEAESGDQKQISEEDSGSADTPLNPLSRGEAGSSHSKREAGSSIQIGFILEILDDIEANLRKIYEHGKRADSIVKSMLLHSRGKSGKPVPTNLNALIDEYLKLAYHGMRAANSSFNIDINTDFDDQLPDIEIVPQDISRAILNIINNAMYAAHEYSKTRSDRKPAIQVTTIDNNIDAVVKIKDNGPGIPEEIREKVFQPFFTTKPTGEGTGLGLSMTNDIIKMHNGTLEIDSEANEFTEFIITIPINISEK